MFDWVLNAPLKNLYINQLWNQSLLNKLCLLKQYTSLLRQKCSNLKIFSSPYFPVFGLNTEVYLVNLSIQSEYEKRKTRKTSNSSTFNALLVMAQNKLSIGHSFTLLVHHCEWSILLILKIYLKQLTQTLD